MTDPYPEARRRARLDTADHGRLIEENRGAYLQDEAEQVTNRLQTIDRALKVVATQASRDALQNEKEDLEARLAWLQDELEHERLR